MFIICLEMINLVKYILWLNATFKNYCASYGPNIILSRSILILILSLLIYYYNLLSSPLLLFLFLLDISELWLTISPV